MPLCKHVVTDSGCSFVLPLCDIDYLLVDKVSLCSSGYLGIHYVDQTGLVLTEMRLSGYFDLKENKTRTCPLPSGSSSAGTCEPKPEAHPVLLCALPDTHDQALNVGASPWHVCLS